MNARKPHTRDEPRPDLSRGDYVRVSEDGIEPWYGRVGAIKPSFDTWRVEVEREDDRHDVVDRSRDDTHRTGRTRGSVVSKRKGPTPRVERWAPFEMDPRSGTDAVRGALVFGNGWWTVHVDVIDEETKWDGWLWLAIHDRPRSTRHDWRELQRVKNAIVGVERDALELYPAEDRLVDTSNEYHLFVMPTGERFPFGFSERTVTDEATPTEIVGAMRQAAEATGSSFNIAQAVKVRQRRRGPG